MNADQLRARMAQLPEPITDKKPPYWEFWRLDLWQTVLIDDPTHFYEWPCVYHTMLVAHWPFQISYELSQLDLNRWRYAIQVPHFGPDDAFGRVKVKYPFSMNLIHQAYHLTQWEQATGKRIEQLDTIVEFGGGYGAMVLLCRRMGFEGKYVIYDLPEFSLLQEYYLSQFGMLDKVEWNSGKNPKDADLFIALYSLSEVEPSKRFGFIQPYAKSFLCLYSGQWEQWDNVNWFQNVLPKIAQYIKNWQHTEITHLPNRNNWYLIGW